MILASILITGDGAIPSPLPPVVAANIQSFKDAHPGMSHTLFSDGMIRDFLSANFDNAVLHAYDELIPFAYKADLARYCILHKLGGVYADLSFLVTAPFLPVGGKLAIFRDVGPTSPWDIYNGMIGAPAGHKALAKAIDMICANVERQYYGTSPVCPTGPTLLGKAVAITSEPEELIVGEVFRPPGSDANYSLIDVATKTLIAINRKKSVGTIETLGITNGNNYNDLWNSLRVYRSEPSCPRSWTAEWLDKRRYSRGRLKDGEIVIAGRDAGVILWGPYVWAEPGSYTATIHCAGSEAHGDFIMDIATSLGQDVLAADQRQVAAGTNGPFELTIPFMLLAAVPRLEIRLHANGPHRITVTGVSLRPD